MAIHAFVEIDVPEAADLADFTGIKYDLDSARELSRRLLKELAKHPPDSILIDALTTAAIVRYARPFTKGVRRILNVRDIDTLTANQRRKHQNLLMIRNKHAAHSVNAFEESQPVARYRTDRAHDEGIYSVECNHHRVMSLSGEEIDDIVELTTTMLKYVETCLKNEKAKVLQIVRRSPLDTVLVGHGGPMIPDTSDPSKQRKSVKRPLKGKT